MTSHIFSRVRWQAVYRFVSENRDGDFEDSMDRDHLVEILERIAQMLELKGENAFKVRAYRSGARAIEGYTGNLAQLLADGQLRSIDGIGDAIASKVTELVNTGQLPFYEELAGEFPEGVFDLLDLPGLGPKKVKILYDQLSVTSLDELREKLENGEVGKLEGFGQKTVENLKNSIDWVQKHARLFLAHDARRDVDAVLEELRAHPACGQLSAAGSFRRGKELVKDVDFVVSSTRPEEVFDAFVSQPSVEEVLLRGETKCTVRFKSGLKGDLRVVEPAQFPFALVHFTGNKDHNVRLRQIAQEKEWRLNEYGFHPETKTAEAIGEVLEEGDVYRELGLAWVPPEMREDRGEIEAARNDEIPRLVELPHLRGVFHVHTDASDGRNSLEEMARCAHDLGLEYLGISDHSKASVQANGLNAERLQQQMELINARNEQDPGLHIFRGVECDILKDGKLDFPDEVLEALDFTIASVHASMNQDESTMTKRVIAAMENPFVTMLGHPTGRLLLRREASKVNLQKVLEAAAATHTIVELNCSPMRQELDWRWWKKARDLGVLCSINPDAHRLDAFSYLPQGIALARKGWLTREDVINCLPLEQVKEALCRKRKLWKSAS
ncbi:MAG: DNA polymerase/3'-5' exonuclease PolX [Verrucomicrobiales bacterium]